MILTAIKSAILRVTGQVVQEVFASTDPIAVEMADLANEVAADIAKSHDWRALTKINTITANGGEAYALPTDYDRMVMGAEIDDQASWFWGYHQFDSVNEWMRFRSGGVSLISPGGWIIIGGEVNFYPAPGGVAQFPYITNQWAIAEDSGRKAAFTADSDIFLLDERLLTLGLIWRWLAQKKMAYAEDMQTYEIALAQAQSRDKGARVLRTPSRVFRNGRYAYSGLPIR